MTLRELPSGQMGTVVQVAGEGALRRRLFDMGVLPGADITMVKAAPLGDPIEYRVDAYELVLRACDAELVRIENVREPTAPIAPSDEAGAVSAASPGQTRRLNLPIGGVQLSFALAGNQNSGKTTLFNRLTGASRRTGNFPGVTVDIKFGAITVMPNATVTDLPGLYSLSPYSKEELAARQFLLDGGASCIINVIDATNLTRSLRLTLQLMELGLPMVIALNMADEVRDSGGVLYADKIEEILGVPAVRVSATTGEGVDELIMTASRVVNAAPPGKPDLSRAGGNGVRVAEALRNAERLIAPRADESGVPSAFAASALCEDDSDVRSRLKLSDSEAAELEEIFTGLERGCGTDRKSALAEARFAFARDLTRASSVPPARDRFRERSEKLDRVLTGRFTAFPILILAMAAIFCLAFVLVGPALRNILTRWMGAFTHTFGWYLDQIGVAPVLRSLITDGIFLGVGTVLSFLPMIIILFLFLSLLEDSGYLARVAFITDRPVKKLGLSGHSVAPFILGFGCTVPGVMACRTLPSERDRRNTVLLLPFISCTAKLPIYTLLAALFFPGKSVLIIPALYVLGLLLGVLAAAVMNKTDNVRPSPFIMELPNYRVPTAKNVLKLLWNRCKDFVGRVFTTVLIASMVVWFMSAFDTHLRLTDNPENSLLATVAGAVAPVLRPLGLDDWRVVAALAVGLLAKENIASALVILFGSAAALGAALDPPSAISMLVFCLLYTPCAATLAAMRRELGWKWATGAALWQLVLAWCAAFLVRAAFIAFI